MKLLLEVIAVLVAIFGMRQVRAGFLGEHLGRGRFVSHVQAHPEEPKWHHRALTAGLGALVILLAAAAFTLLWVGPAR